MYKLEYFEKELSKSFTGKKILRVVYNHYEEIIFLVNHNRNVMLTWQRNHGPMFANAAIESGFDENYYFKKEVNGITLQHLLLKMADALQDNGSPELKRVIGEYTVFVLNYVERFNALKEIFNHTKTID